MAHSGELLRYYRIQKNLSTEELAESANISPRTLNLIENGDREMRLSEVSAFCKRLEIPPNALIEPSSTFSNSHHFIGSGTGDNHININLSLDESSKEYISELIRKLTDKDRSR